MSHKAVAAVMVGAAVLVVAAGCPRTPKPQPPAVTPMVNALAPQPSGVPPTMVTPTLPTGEMGKIVTAHNQVTSYHVVISTAGKTNMKADVKAADGKPVALLIRGNMLIQPAQQAVYLLESRTRTAQKIAFTKTAQGFTGKLPDPLVLAGKHPTITDAKLGKTPCWLLQWTGPNQAPVSMWISKQYGLPLQRKSGATVTTYAYSNINKVPDSVFNVPSGYATKEMTAAGPAPGSAPTPPAKAKKGKARPAHSPTGSAGLTPAGP